MVESAVALVREIYPDSSFLFRSGVSPRASLDPLRIEQVVVNLLDNAAKFSPKDGPVEIELSVEARDAAVISVRDHGPGIAEGDRERVFERFHQVHPEQHYGGMGLGLYISREFVRMHGGTITCEAPEGGGARFVVRLPLEAGDRGGNGDGMA